MANLIKKGGLFLAAAVGFKATLSSPTAAAVKKYLVFIGIFSLSDRNIFSNSNKQP